MRWSARYCHKRRQKRSSGGQSLLYSQVLGTGDVAHGGPPRKDTSIVRKQKIGEVGSFIEISSEKAGHSTVKDWLV